MANDSAIAALCRSRAEDSTRKQKAVLAALDHLVAQGAEVNISAVARASGVSRQFVYTHRALRDAITSATISALEPIHAERAADMAAGLRADRRILAAKVERQAVTIAALQQRLETLERQRQRWLGTQLSLGAAIDPETHAELRITNERLIADNTALAGQVAELRRINTMLEADLTASRQAHAEDVATLSGTIANVAVLGHRATFR